MVAALAAATLPVVVVNPRRQQPGLAAPRPLRRRHGRSLVARRHQVVTMLASAPSTGTVALRNSLREQGRPVAHRSRRGKGRSPSPGLPAGAGHAGPDRRAGGRGSLQPGQWHSAKRTVWGGRARVRAALYMGALVASRFNPVIREFYQRLLAAGKPKKLALTACMRKLLVILNSMLKHRSPWRAKRARDSALVGHPS